MPLSTLFDLELCEGQDHHWSKLYNSHAWVMFNEELELYDLMELDADGENNIGLDESTQDILSS